MHALKLVLTLFTTLAMVAGAEAQVPYYLLQQPAGPNVLRTAQAVARIQAPGGSGSGTLVARNGGMALILSCRHVCRQPGGQVTVSWPLAGGQPATGTIVHVVRGRDFDTDLALVTVRAPRGVRPVEVARFSPANGPWFSIGHRSGQVRLAVASLAQEKPGGLIESNAPYVGGMSGGGMFDRNGRLVGVVVASDNINGYSSNGFRLRQLLALYGKRYPRRFP